MITVQERIKQIRTLPKVSLPEDLNGVYWNDTLHRLELRHAGKLELSVSYESLSFIGMKGAEGRAHAIETSSSPLKYVLRFFFCPSDPSLWPDFYLGSDAAKV